MTVESQSPILQVRNLNLHYGAKQALFNIHMDLARGKVTALIGPSGCGKSTFLRCLNRMNDLVESAQIHGKILYGDVDIYQPNVDVVQLRQHIGMIFQKSTPFNLSIYENIVYGPRFQGVKNKNDLDEMVESCLRRAALWDEAKDRLHQNALGLSGGQQQRLCIARSLATKPEILLMDEPTSALDPISTSRIEDLIAELSGDLTVVIVTHNMQQAARVSDETAFFYEGEVVEFGPTQTLFTNPAAKRTEDYISGRFG